jgi:acetylornithine deacetylase/succinyl-diaminopimelate desuccinylase-like protein
LAIDALLKVHFNPIRTVIFAVGFDEEGGADVGQGARCLAERLLKDYGEDGIELIVRLTLFAFKLRICNTKRTKADTLYIYTHSSTKESQAFNLISEPNSLSSPQQKRGILTLP